ncbi:MAG: hypothetical protein M0Z58_09235 [Nitrospiraceae bacterium]|nr:hypothetical protein [Nitrospiraceae bacterium]
MKIAHLVQTHKNPVQVNKFIRQIAGDGHSDVYVHIDKKNAGNIAPRIAGGRNIKIIGESMDVKWGDISLVDATLCLLRDANKSGMKYDFVCLRSGQDLLVRNGLREYLARNNGKIFMNAKKTGSGDETAYFWSLKWPSFTRERHDSVFHPARISRAALIRLYRLGINAIPNPNKPAIDVYRGSAWFCIPGEVAAYILDYLENNPWYYKAFRDALAPDEYFFQTIIMNSPYASGSVCNNLTYLRFGETFLDNNHPRTLTVKDISGIEKSDKFFARKFDETVDNNVIEYFCRRCGA